MAMMVPIPGSWCSFFFSRRNSGALDTVLSVPTEMMDPAYLELVRCHYNFVRPHRALRFGRETRTPAMQAGLVKRGA